MQRGSRLSSRQKQRIIDISDAIIILILLKHYMYIFGKLFQDLQKNPPCP